MGHTLQVAILARPPGASRGCEGSSTVRSRATPYYEKGVCQVIIDLDRPAICRLYGGWKPHQEGLAGHGTGIFLAVILHGSH